MNDIANPVGSYIELGDDKTPCLAKGFSFRIFHVYLKSRFIIVNVPKVALSILRIASSNLLSGTSCRLSVFRIDISSYLMLLTN